MMNEQKKAAFVAVVGRPSAGKSTLVNTLCGRKVAIVSAVPQTTRNAIRGILTRDEGQLVFIDTPGRHQSEKKFNKKLMEVGERAIEDAELILYVLDLTRVAGPEEEDITRLLAPKSPGLIVALNKTDAKGADAGAAREFLMQKLPLLPPENISEVSALSGAGCDALLDLLFRMAPPGGALYPEDYYTDQDIQFRISEIIREKAIMRLRQELPHAIYAEVADAEFREDKTRLWVRAFLIVERESQKGMVVGKGGAMIRDIRLAALKEMNSIFDWKIELDLRVKTAKDWRHNDRLLKKLIGR
jgi:GTP-binding protein Era